jgi:hypothetical protein
LGGPGRGPRGPGGGRCACLVDDFGRDISRALMPDQDQLDEFLGARRPCRAIPGTAS